MFDYAVAVVSWVERAVQLSLVAVIWLSLLEEKMTCAKLWLVWHRYQSHNCSFSHLTPSLTVCCNSS